MKRIVLSLLGVLLLTGSACAMDLYEYQYRVRMALVGGLGLTNDPIADSILNMWINDGRILVAGLTGVIEKDTTINVTTGTANYNLPSDFVSLRGIITPPNMTTADLAGGPVGADIKSPEAIGDQPTSDGFIDGAVDWGTATPVLWLDPAPFGNYAIRVQYTAEPLLLDTTNTTCELPGACQRAVIEYAKARAYESQAEDEREAKCDAKFNAYWQAIKALLKESRERERRKLEQTPPQ